MALSWTLSTPSIRLVSHLSFFQQNIVVEAVKALLTHKAYILAAAVEYVTPTLPKRRDRGRRLRACIWVHQGYVRNECKRKAKSSDPSLHSSGCVSLRGTDDIHIKFDQWEHRRDCGPLKETNENLCEVGGVARDELSQPRAKPHCLQSSFF